VIDGFAKLGQIDKSIEWFEKMKTKSIRPDVFTYGSIVNGYVEMRNMQESVKWVIKMQKDRIKPDIVIFHMIIKGCAAKKDIQNLRNILEYINKMGVQANEVTQTILQKYLSKSEIDDILTPL